MSTRKNPDKKRDVIETRIIDRATAHPSVEDLFEEKRARLDAIKNYWKDKVLGRDEYDLRAQKEAKDLMNKQLNEVAKIYDEYIYQLQFHAEAKNPDLPNLKHTLMQIASERADAKIKPQIETFEAVLNKRGKNTEGFGYAHQELQAQQEFMRLTKTHPELKVIFEKLQQNKPLSDDDSKKLINALDVKRMNMKEIAPTTTITPQTTLEVAFGYVFGKMSEPERVRLIELMLENKDKGSVAPALIEQAVIQGLIDKDAENLFTKALSLNVITASQFAEYKSKLARGYQKEKREFEESMRTWMNITYKGRPYKNEAARFVDELPKRAVQAWAVITGVLNFLPDIRNPLTGFRKLLKNPWGLAALGALGVTTKGFGLGKTEEDPEQVASRERAKTIERFKEAYARFPSDLKKYLENDGVTSIHKVSEILADDPVYERRRPQDKPAIFFNRLMNYERRTNPSQYMRLVNLKNSKTYPEEVIIQDMYHASVAIARLHITDSKKLKMLVYS